MKTCTFCLTENIPDAAQKCRACGEWFGKYSTSSFITGKNEKGQKTYQKVTKPQSLDDIFLNKLHTIESSMIFFVVLTVINLILSFVVVFETHR
jgi:hypothetical protein